MTRNIKNCVTLFTSTLYLSTFTFGGGYVIIPFMKKKFVDQLGWVDEEDMLNMAAIAQSSPGAIAVNAAILVGWRVMGFIGAIIAIVGTVLPPLIILSVISMFYTVFRDNEIVNAILKGMMAGICAIIFDVVITMGSNIIKLRKILPIIIMIGAFIANFILKINVIYIIIFCGILGSLITAHDKKSGKDHL